MPSDTAWCLASARHLLYRGVHVSLGHLVSHLDNSDAFAMTRPPRDEAPGAIHHAVPQGSSRRRIVEDDRDRTAYLNRFDRVGRDLGWIVHASSLMDTHHHAVVETAEPNLGEGMRRVQGGHARWLNARHGGGPCVPSAVLVQTSTR